MNNNYNYIAQSYPKRVGLNAFRRIDLNYGGIFRNLDKNSRILEIGPGSSFFTQYLLVNGFKNIEICELDKQNADELNVFFDKRLTVINRDAIDYLLNSEAKYDVIVSMQVIEHFDNENVKKFINAMASGLNKNGLLVIETINCSHIIGNYLRYSDATHLTGFTPRSLNHYLQLEGNFSDIEYLEIYSHNNLTGLLKLFFTKKRLNKKLLDKLGFLKSGDSFLEKGHRDVSILKTLLQHYSFAFFNLLSQMLLSAYEVEGISVNTPSFAVKCKKCS